MSNPDDGRGSVLLVEDNETIRHAFSILLEDSGYRVVPAASGAEALALARSEKPRLALMDLGLPDMSGLEVARRLRDDEGTRQIVVVALTGRALETDANACRDAGCADYLAKPIASEQLLRKVAEYMEG